MHTAALFAFPDPRSIAARPVDWIAEIMFEGGSVPLVVTIFDGIEKDVSCMPGNCLSALERSLTQLSQDIGTEKVAS